MDQKIRKILSSYVKVHVVNVSSPNLYSALVATGWACFNDDFFSHYQGNWLCNDWWIVIFGISHGVVIQLNVSNSSTTGTKKITINTKITAAMIITIFLFIILLTLKMSKYCLWLVL